LESRDISNLGGGYSEEHDALVIPLVENNYWMRLFSSENKYHITGKKQALFLHSSSPSDTCVIVEDLRSAIKVSRVVTTLCLFGTSLPPSQWYMLDRQKRIIIWLDGDKPGVDAATKLFKKLTLRFKNVVMIKTPQDPKWYSLEEIKCHLNIH
jgi:hypothetical protein